MFASLMIAPTDSFDAISLHGAVRRVNCYYKNATNSNFVHADALNPHNSPRMRSGGSLGVTSQASFRGARLTTITAEALVVVT